MQIRPGANWTNMILHKIAKTQVTMVTVNAEKCEARFCNCIFVCDVDVHNLLIIYFFFALFFILTYLLHVLVIFDFQIRCNTRCIFLRHPKIFSHEAPTPRGQEARELGRGEANCGREGEETRRLGWWGRRSLGDMVETGESWEYPSWCKIWQS